MTATVMAAFAHGAPALIARDTREALRDLELAWPRWLPLAAAAAGAIAALTQATLRWAGLIPAVAAIAAIVAVSWVTRGIHERGIARFMRDRERASSGAVMGVMAARFILLLSIAPAAWGAALIAALVWSRAAIVMVARVGDVRPDASDEDGILIPHVDSADVFLAAALSLPLVAWGRGLGVSAGIAAFVAAFVAGIVVHRRQAGLDAAATSLVLVVGELAVLAWFAIARPAVVSPWIV